MSISEEGPLGELFCASLRSIAREELPEPAVLEQALEELVGRARAAWPDVGLGVEQFLPFVAERLTVDLGLNDVRAAELYLTCGCLQRDPAALAAFEAFLMPEAERALDRMNLGASTRDEVKQRVRKLLFVPDGGRPAKIREYGGRGELRSWVQAVALRTALDLVRRPRAEARFEEVMHALPSPALSAELEYMKRLYGAEFRQALAAGLAALSRRERNLLRHHHLHGLDLEQMGTLYRVHRATAARWLARARERLADETRRALSARLQLAATEIQSIMRLLESQLDLSLGNLADTDEE